MKLRKNALFLIILLVIIIYLLYPFLAFFLDRKDFNLDEQTAIFIGGGGNSLLFLGEEFPLLFDTKAGFFASSFARKIQALTASKKIVLVNSHFHGDHTGANYLFKDSRIIAGQYPAGFWEKQNGKEGIPGEFLQKTLILINGKEKIHLIPVGQAHSFADLVAYFPARKLLTTGDIFFHKIHPVFQNYAGTNVQKWIAALDKLAKELKFDKVLPGHGQMASRQNLLEFKNYLLDLQMTAKGDMPFKVLHDKYAEWQNVPYLSSLNKNLNYVRNNQ
ncbi:MBL fold metallo-hydrolase [Candidatus Riflebacteria bacterium]